MKSTIFVVIQFLSITILGITGPTAGFETWVISIAIVGMLIGSWAMIAMRKSQLSVFPDVKVDSVLVTNGPYAIIRHPMYTGLLLVMVSFFLMHPVLWRGGVLVIFGINLFYKIQYEEKLLRDHFPMYEKYTESTSSLIPFVY